MTNQPSLAEVRERFSHDRFATDACGCEVVEARPGHSVCAFDIMDRHRNQIDVVMGGAIFTLADFAMAVASNVAAAPTVAVSNTIEFLRSTRGSRLTATSDVVKDGRTLSVYATVVTDDLGVEVARMTATCYHLSEEHHG